MQFLCLFTIGLIPTESNAALAAGMARMFGDTAKDENLEKCRWEGHIKIAA